MNTALSTTTPAASARRVTTRLNPPVIAGETWFAKLSRKLIEWQNRTTQRDHLRTMDDRLLADMGITRADAEHESRKPFWQA